MKAKEAAKYLASEHGIEVKPGTLMNRLQRNKLCAYNASGIRFTTKKFLAEYAEIHDQLESLAKPTSLTSGLIMPMALQTEVQIERNRANIRAKELAIMTGDLKPIYL